MTYWTFLHKKRMKLYTSHLATSTISWHISRLHNNSIVGGSCSQIAWDWSGRTGRICNTLEATVCGGYKCSLLSKWPEYVVVSQRNTNCMENTLSVLIRQVLLSAEEVRGVLPSMPHLLSNSINSEACRGKRSCCNKVSSMCYTQYWSLSQDQQSSLA